MNNTYYHNAIDNRVLFRSDWALCANAFSFGKLRDKPKEWDSDFTEAMVKLSKLPAEGKDVRKCSATNKPS
jgi:peroxidase